MRDSASNNFYNDVNEFLRLLNVFHEWFRRNSAHVAFNWLCRV